MMRWAGRQASQRTVQPGAKLLVAHLLGCIARGCHASVPLSLRKSEDNPCWDGWQAVGLPACGHTCMRSLRWAPGISNLHHRGVPCLFTCTLKL